MTTEEKPKFASMLCLAGATLMFVNALLVGMNGGPLMLSSGSIRSPNDVISNTADLWFRISFGFKGWVEGFLGLFWIIMSLVMVYCATRLYIKPIERKELCMIIALFSALSIPYGGGFIVGCILGFLGAGIGYAWPAKSQDALFYKLVQAARLSSNFFERLKKNENGLRLGVYSLVLANIMTALGSAIYSYSVRSILEASSSNVPFRILLLGEMPLDASLILTVVLNVGLAIFKWIVLSFIIYIIGIGLLEKKQTLSTIAAAAGFAYVPVSLQLFIPFLLTSKPYLSFGWPFAVVVITNVWMILVLLVGIKQTLEISLGKTLGILSISGAIYILLRETFFMTLTIPNMLQFSVQPQIVLLAVISSLVLASVLFGTYTKH